MKERLHRRLAIGAVAFASGVGGLAVGLLDGVRAAVLVGTPAVLMATLLTASVDGVLAVVAGGAVELVARVAAWGRRERAPLGARVFAYTLVGACAALATYATAVATHTRHNRFLAAGLVALAALGAGLAGTVVGPAVARAAALGRARPREVRAGSAAWLLWPLLLGVGGAIVMLTLARISSRAMTSAAARYAVWAMLTAALLPAALALAEAWPRRVPRGLAAVGAIVLGGGLLAALAASWNDHLRFAPWDELAVGAVVAAVTALLLWKGRARLPRRTGLALAAAGALLVGGLTLVAVSSRSAGARKVAGARAAFVGPALAMGRAVLDFDHDGYARALGGGDCDDGDPEVHPGALDLPGDGVDADCDGSDESVGPPPPAVMAPVPAAVPAELNLILVTIDTLRADHLGCYGYARPTSPAIDALAAEGALFENGWAHAPSTRYSMPAIASGRWPSLIAWDESIWWPRMAPQVRTVAQALHDGGYTTGGLFSYSYFARNDHRGFERGMDVYRDDRAALHEAVNGPMESRGSSSREMTDDAIAFVDDHRAGKFFLWVHYYDPHLGYETHPEVPDFGASRVDRYDGEIRFTDLQFGRLLAHLRSVGQWDRTAVVVTGDHGEGFGEHGVTEHGFDLYRAQTQVPFIVRVPGLPARRVRVPVGHVDLAPTLVNLARGRAEPSFIGRSLLPDLAGPPAADTETRAVFQEVTSERGKKRALVTAARHLVWNAVPGDTTECYDRTRDPDEARDIWEDGGDESCRELAERLRRLVTGLALPPMAAARMAQQVTPAGRTAPAPAHPLDATLGDAIGVRGFDLPAGTVHPGEAADVTVHFAVRRRIGPEWRLFFHLEGPGGFRNLDHVPVEGLMPLDRWRPGQQLRDHQRIAFPPGAPAGVYTLYVGAYRQKGERMPAAPASLSDGRDRLRLLTITVAR
jgi:arylsulfatase A-like enzyme